MSAPTILGAVLVGGRSRRMGRDKALIEIDGLTLVERTAATLRQAGCDPVVAIGPRRLAASVRHVDDDAPGEGPLGGILTALDRASLWGARAAMVVACDLPGLDPATLSKLLTAAVARIHPDPGDVGDRPPGQLDQEPAPAFVVIAESDRLEPLCAVWSGACAPVLRRHFDSGARAVHRAMTGLEVIEFKVANSVLRNVNTPDDLRNE